ncbi:MAG: hypothetical protein WD597_09465, partial [Balneolaceae bacterium]
MKNLLKIITSIVLLLLLGMSEAAMAQESTDKIIVEPSSLELQLNEEVQLQARVVDENGNALPDSVIFFTRNRRSLTVSTNGLVKAIASGSFNITARTISGRENALSVNIPVEVAYPPITEIQFLNTPKNVYEGTSLALKLALKDATGQNRDNVEYTLTSSAPAIASVDDFGNLRAHKTGNFTLTAEAENVKITWKNKVVKNPVSNLEMSHNYENKTVRTGDVIRFSSSPKKSNGEVVADAPVSYSFMAEPDDKLGQGASAQIEQDGRFVANKPGVYTVMAKTGNSFSEATFRVVNRNVQRPIEIAGKGIVSHTRTSDLWVWEGVDGRDYALTGTWGGNGETIFWDVNDPTNIFPIDTVTV